MVGRNKREKPNLNFQWRTNILPRIALAGKALLKRPETLAISTSEFVRLWGPQRITSFVSVGANDGKKNDPIAEFIDRYRWRGIMVEPLPQNFARLSENYRMNENLILENVGITATPGTFDLYYVTNVTPNEPDWYDQIASFDRSTILKSISENPDLKHRIGTCRVPTVTLEMLLDKHAMQEFDLLIIDAEGYDYQILSSINLRKYRPSVIILEYEWLTTYERRAAVSLLRGIGYHPAFNNFDCIAVR